MNIILLSGGSGKRLWPLSDEVRSKQFLKLFQNEDGTAESMIQRVHRQILKNIPDANIIVATGETQVGLIREQLGDSVKICKEPDRRDTFPAIILATAFMHYELGISNSESVIICPVDPYVDDSYFDSLKELETLSKKGLAKILLMGVHPTYPSEKYGYIIPENNSHISPVESFKEKPDVETAKKYLFRHALWNAGVFACNIKYLLDIARHELPFLDYSDLYQKYNMLPRISFDYAVVEQEDSIYVVRYYGQWKDIGTWNVLAETMTKSVLGNVILDEKCKNVNAINELDIPILCVGCNDIVVSASNNGILVADKQSSEAIKMSLELINSDKRNVVCNWGSYRIVDVQANSLTLVVHIEASSHTKYHSHAFRDEIWTVVAGCGVIVIEGKKSNLKTGDVVRINAGYKHMIESFEKMILIGTEIGNRVDKEDVILCDVTEN